MATVRDEIARVADSEIYVADARSRSDTPHLELVERDEPSLRIPTVRLDEHELEVSFDQWARVEKHEPATIPSILAHRPPEFRGLDGREGPAADIRNICSRVKRAVSAPESQAPGDLGGGPFGELTDLGHIVGGQTEGRARDANRAHDRAVGVADGCPDRVQPRL